MARPPANGPAQLRRRLDDTGTSQRALEQQLGVSAGLVSRWLSGDRVPSLRTAFEIERLLGVPASVWAAGRAA